MNSPGRQEVLRSIRACAGAAAFYLATAVLTVLLGVVCLSAPPVRQNIMRVWARAVLRFLDWFCGLRYRVTGLENMPRTPAIYACKHQSAWEVVALTALLPKKSFVLKREIHYIPFIGWCSALASATIAIDRHTGATALRHVVRCGAERLRQGFSVVVFPEGTRVAPGASGRYHPGLGALAAETGCPVVPVAHNAGWFWRRRQFIKWPGCVSVAIGCPIATAGREAREISEETRSAIEGICAGLPAADSEQGGHFC